MMDPKDYKTLRGKLAKAMDTNLEMVSTQMHLLLSIMSRMECCGNCENYNPSSTCKATQSSNYNRVMPGTDKCGSWNLDRKRMHDDRRNGDIKGIEPLPE